MHFSTWRSVVMATSLCWFGANAKGNLVANGNFEGGTYTYLGNGSTEILPNFWNLSPPSTFTLSDTNVVAASAFPGYSDPDGGNYYVAFNSTSNPLTTGQDCLNQALQTTPGDTYTISFYAALTEAAVPNTFLSIEWDGGSGYQYIDIFTSSSGPGTSGFIHYTFDFQTSLASTTFWFHATDSPASGGAILVDDLDVELQEDTPEPASLLLMSLGLVIIGLHYMAKRGAGPTGHRHRL